jgi:predicted  nucleic acid-binding Zn-ribbon protein
MASQTDRTKNTSRIILVIASTLALSALGFFAVKYFTQKEALREGEDKIEKLTLEVLDLEDRILEFQVDKRSQQEGLDRKNEELKSAKEKIVEFRAEIQRLNKNSEEQTQEIRILNKRLSNMESLIAQYEAQIRQLIAEKQALQNQLDTAELNIQQLTEINEDILSNNSEVKEELDATRKLGSILKTKDFKYFSLKEKGNGKEKEIQIENNKIHPYRMHDFRLYFTIQDNQVARSGERIIYLVYENPDGTINQNLEEGFGGTFNYMGQERKYSSSKKIDYRNITEEFFIDFEIEEGFKYQGGPQFISLFTSDGNLIGQGQFDIGW